MKNKPVYGIDSVDHALLLATTLLQEGSLRITDAAARLGVSRSTAHRLLAMLVYRDFAEQDERRRYVAGPLLRRPTAPEPVAGLRRLALPHLEALSARTGESTHLVVVVSDQARFVATVECDQVLRVGDREGRMLPAHLVSAGRAALATRDDDAVRALYADAARRHGRAAARSAPGAPQGLRPKRPADRDRSGRDRMRRARPVPARPGRPVSGDADRTIPAGPGRGVGP